LILNFILNFIFNFILNFKLNFLLATFSHSWGLQVALTFVFPPERPLFTGEKRGSRVVKMCIVQQYARLGLNPSLALTLARSLGPIYAIPLSTLLFLHGFYDRTPKYSRGRLVYQIAV
ncbi:uncharacterized protein LOC117138484, partial [Drosophila mauritiana]|uniref:Uncharacterized protein LOC117138484 n=1 Tax=Drosophila mauritiana TaxID=7226 RepID=A0A6P8JKS6_DROMA